MAVAAPTTTMDVPESQRLIAVSLGKIAASRGQKGGINLHKNLLVATVLHKARTAYMIQHFNAAKQRAATPTATATPPPSPPCVEMKEQKSVSESSQPTSTTSSPPSAGSTTTFQSPSPTAAPQSVTPSPETASIPEGAAGSCMQVAECEDKENTPPPSPCRDATPPSPSSMECEKRLQGEVTSDGVKDSKPALSSRPSAVSHGQQNNHTKDYVSRSSSCCLLKRRRAMDRDHENVSAPKVRIVESRVSSDCSNSSSSSSSPEPMQCDSPQISNLVNIFNTSFSGLSGASAASGDVSVRNVGQSILTSVSSHKLSENLTCAKEMKVGLDSVHQPLMLSV